MDAVNQSNIDALMRLGLSEYEAKVYLGLVSLRTGVAGRIYRASGVPRPRVYEVLESLSQKGLVDIQEGRPMRYTAKSPSEAIRALVQSYRKTGEDLMHQLKKIEAAGPQRMSHASAWSIRGESQILGKLKELILYSKDDVSFYRLPERLIKLRDVFIKARSRGIRLRCLVFEDDSTIWKMSNTVEFRNPLKRIATTKGEYPQAVLEILRDVFIEGAPGRPPISQMTIIDDSQSMIVEDWDSALWLQVPVITRTQKLVFDNLWKVSQPVGAEVGARLRA